MSQIHATTIIARNYLPYARVLAQSLREHHSGVTFCVLVLDDLKEEIRADAEGFEIVRPSELVDTRELHRMAMIYSVMELSTALKPFLLRALLERGWPHALYLDPDIRVYQPIDDLADLAERYHLVLTPHTSEPIARDGRKPSEFDILSSGVYNLGFLGVDPQSHSFLDYWSERLRRDCLVDHHGMMFTDQRWVDFVPGYYAHHIERDPTLNVAYWNVDRRGLKRVEGKWEVDGGPLRFFHFSGFDPAKPYLLSKHQGERPRVLLSEHPDLARLCGEYAAELSEAGWSAFVDAPYGFDLLPCGVRVDSRTRRVYREALLRAEAGDGREPPDPLSDNTSSEFLNWLSECPRPGLPLGISRYLEMLYRDRGDLHQRVPNLAGSNGERFLNWVIKDGQFQERIPLQLVPAPIEPMFLEQKSPLKGVNAAGFFKAELGVGEGGRLMVEMLEAAGEQTSTYTFEATASRQEHAFRDRLPGSVPFDLNLLCVNSDRTAQLRAEADEWFFSTGYTVGMWAWETEGFPSSMQGAFDLIDEVWAVSEFTARVLRKYTSKPVHAVPHPVPIPTVAKGASGLSELMPDDRFVFLFMFDFFSVMERKNPLGLVEAFKRAFSVEDRAALVIKSVNGDKVPAAREALRAAVADRPDIYLLDRYVESRERHALLRDCHAYVSLHRGEGFGLTMAEAMALGKPVIATAYSGNLDFMTPENSFLVGYDFVEIPKGCDPYPAGGHWAEPNLDEASDALRTVFQSTELAAERGLQAQQDIETYHSLEARARIVRKRLDEIRSAVEERSTGPQLLAADPLIEVTDRVVRHPEVSGTSRWGKPKHVARKLLMRMLRPYWFGQKKIDEIFVDVARDERLRRESMDRDLQSQLNRMESDVGSVRELSGSVHAHLSRLTAELGAALAQVDELSRRVEQLASSRGQSSAAQPLGGGIDQPQDGAEVDRAAVLVSGWALTGPHPVVRVEIRAEGLARQNARIGLPRPDLDILHASAEAAVSGFEAWLDLEALNQSTDQVSIEALAYSADGAAFPLGTRRLTLRSGPVAPVPSVTRITRRSRQLSGSTESTGDRRLLVFARDMNRAGAQLALLDVLSGLPRGLKATVLSPSDGPLRGAFEALGHLVEISGRPPLDDPEEYERWVGSQSQRVAHHPFDAVLVSTLVPFWGIEISETLGIPSLWSLHEHFSPAMFWASQCHDDGAVLDGALLKRAESALERATEVVLPTAATIPLLRRHRRSENFTIVREAMDVEGFAVRCRKVDSDDARREAGFDPETRVVACIGSVQPSKGQVTLARAMDYIKVRHPTAHLVCVGSRDGDYDHGLRRYVDGADLASRVSLVPFREDVTTWYAIADLVVCPSDNEVQPRVLLEAMSCAVPVVATSVGGIPEMVIDGHSGYLCAPSDVTSLAVGIDRALRASPHQRDAITRQAFKIAKTRHDAASRRSAFEALVTRLLENGSSAEEALES